MQQSNTNGSAARQQQYWQQQAINHLSKQGNTHPTPDEIKSTITNLVNQQRGAPPPQQQHQHYPLHPPPITIPPPPVPSHSAASASSDSAPRIASSNEVRGINNILATAYQLSSKPSRSEMMSYTAHFTDNNTEGQQLKLAAQRGTLPVREQQTISSAAAANTQQQQSSKNTLPVPATAYNPVLLDGNVANSRSSFTPSPFPAMGVATVSPSTNDTSKNRKSLKHRNKEKDKDKKKDKKRKPEPLSPSNNQQADKRPRMTNSASTQSLSSTYTSALSAQQSIDSQLVEFNTLLANQAQRAELNKKRKEEQEREMKILAEEEARLDALMKQAEQQRLLFEQQKQQRQREEQEEEQLLRQGWKEEEWFLDMIGLRRKIIHSINANTEQTITAAIDDPSVVEMPPPLSPLRVTDESVVELICLSCQMYIKTVLDALIHIRNKRIADERLREELRQRGQIIEGADVMQIVTEAEKERLAARERQRQKEEQEEEEQLQGINTEQRHQSRMSISDSQTLSASSSSASSSASSSFSSAASSSVRRPPPSRLSDPTRVTVPDLLCYLSGVGGSSVRASRLCSIYLRHAQRVRDWPKEYQQAVLSSSQSSSLSALPTLDSTSTTRIIPSTSTTSRLSQVRPPTSNTPLLPSQPTAASSSSSSNSTGTQQAMES